jgi:hypothetical protein
MVKKIHQYQQNEQSPLTITHWIWNPGLGLWQAHTCGGVNPVDVIDPNPNWLITGSSMAIQIETKINK